MGLGFCLWVPLISIASLKAQFPHTDPMGLGFQYVNFRGKQFSPCSWSKEGNPTEVEGHWFRVQILGCFFPFSRSVVSDSLRPHESRHTRPPCPSPTPGVHPDLGPLSQWCHPAISSLVVPFFSCPQSLPASKSYNYLSHRKRSTKFRLVKDVL